MNATVRGSNVYMDKEESEEEMCSQYIIINFSYIYMLTDAELAERLLHARKVPGSNPLPLEVVLNAYGVIAMYSCGPASRFV